MNSVVWILLSTSHERADAMDTHGAMLIACTGLCRIPLVEDIKQLTSERVDEAKMALHVRGRVPGWPRLPGTHLLEHP